MQIQATASFCERDHGTFPIGTVSHFHGAAGTFGFALIVHHVHFGDFYFEKFFHRTGDLDTTGRGVNPESILVVLDQRIAFFRDNRRDDDVISTIHLTSSLRHTSDESIERILAENEFLVAEQLISLEVKNELIECGKQISALNVL